MLVLSSCEAILQCVAVYYCSRLHNRNFIFAPNVFGIELSVHVDELTMPQLKGPQDSVLLFRTVTYDSGGFKIEENSKLARH